MERKPAPAVPSVRQLEEELKREKYRGRYKRLLRGTVSTVLVVIAAAVLISNLLLPILRIYGSSMSPTLVNGNIVTALRGGSYGRGDIVAFYYNDKILVKRIVGLPGEVIDIDEEGSVSVDGEPLDEPYLDEKALGECDIKLPYQVPEGRYFVMGDNQAGSDDSRMPDIGNVSREDIYGKVWFVANFGSNFGFVKD